MSFRAGFIALLGRPNSGKSTLLNALVGEKLAIVTPKPQTTRTRIQGVVTRDSAQMVFVDTPGILEPRSRLDRALLQAARDALASVDLLLLLADCRREPVPEDRLVVNWVKDARAPAFLLLNKIDLLGDKARLLPVIEAYSRLHDFEETLPVSARTGANLPELERLIAARLPEAPPLFPEDTLTDQPERFRAAEIVREKILLRTREEVPYASAVVVEKYEESDRLVRIHAAVLVERDGQKGILIGGRGRQMKEIGAAARRELETLLQRKVYLELFVKTRAAWREEEGVARLIDWRLGGL